MLWASLHRLHCIQSVSIVPQCMESSAFNDAARNPLHSVWMLWAKLHKINCIQSCCIKSTAFNRVPFFTVHGIHCIQSRCMESTAFNRYDLSHAACNPLHSIGMLWAMLHIIQCIQSGCIWPRSIDSTAYNKDQLQHNAWNPLHSMMLH